MHRSAPGKLECVLYNPNGEEMLLQGQPLSNSSTTNYMDRLINICATTEPIIHNNKGDLLKTKSAKITAEKRILEDSSEPSSKHEGRDEMKPEEANSRTVSITVDAQARALKSLSDIKEFEVGTADWDWNTVFGFVRPARINWKLYKVEGPNGQEVNPSDKIFQSIDKMDPTAKHFKVVLQSRKPVRKTSTEKKDKAAVAGGVKEKKGAAVKVPKGRQPPGTPKSPKGKLNGKLGDKDAKEKAKSPGGRKKSDVALKSPKPNGEVADAATPKQKGKTPKAKDQKSTPARETGGGNTAGEKGTMVLGMQKDKVPSVGLVFDAPKNPPPPVAEGGPAGKQSKKRAAGADAAADPNAPPAKKAAKNKKQQGDAAVAEVKPETAEKKKGGKKQQVGETQQAKPGAVVGSVMPMPKIAPGTSAAMAERIARLNEDPNAPITIQRPVPIAPAAKSPTEKKKVSKVAGGSNVQAVTNRFNKFVDPSVASDIIAECKKIKEHPETRNFMRQRAAYIYNMVMHVFLNE